VAALHRPTILAIDPATQTGFALGVTGSVPQLITKRWSIPGDKLEDRFGRASYFINGALTGVDYVAIEAPILAYSNTQWDTILLLVGLHGIFTGAARSRQIPVMVVAAASWRKHFLGTSKMEGGRGALKAEAMRRCRWLKWDAPDDNAADAAGIFNWAESQIAPEIATRSEPLFAGTAR
jgi:hypothetical protein